MLPIAILAGGLATRLRPLTDTVPKSLVDVEGEPFAAHQLRLLHRNGLTEVVMCVGHLGPQIGEAIGDGSKYGVRVTYVEDGPELLGTGGALRNALPLLGDAFLVMYGDSYLDCDYQSIAASFTQSGALGLMTVYRNEGKWERSNIRFENGAIVDYDKTTSDPRYCHVDYGLGALRAAALSRFPERRRFDLAEVFRGLIDRDQLGAYEVSTRFFEIGSVEGLQETRLKIAALRNP